MIPPCNNCGGEKCHFCHLARTDPRYAKLYGREDLPFAQQHCTYRGEETGRTKCESCGGNVEVKIFSCSKHGQCSIEKDVGHKICGICPDRRPFDLHHAYDWFDLGAAVPGEHRKFNSSLLRYRGELILATRIHTMEGWSAGRIFINRLNDEFRQNGETVEIKVNHPQAEMGLEDPRLFIHRGRLHVSFTGVQKADGGIATSQLYARLGDNLAIEELFAPHFPDRQDWEKNWGFFSEEGQLYAVYNIPGQQILKIDGNAARMMYRSETVWPDSIALQRGGAAPIKRGNEYYCFFHDVRDGADGFREYKLCLYTFEDKPPFRVNRIARVPLFSVDKSQRPNDTWTPHVIFPCGAFLENNLWHVSAGYMDRWSWLLRFDVNRCEELLDVAHKSRDSVFNVNAACLSPHQSYDIWANVYNRNEYEIPASIQGCTVVDLGGHIGSFARLCLDRGAERVISVEPLAENCRAYRHNLRGLESKYQLIEGAAYGGEPPEEATMGGYSLLEAGDWERVPVATIHLGRLECDLLKIDVEGAEYEILPNSDLSGVKRICGEGHLGNGLPGIEWLMQELQAKGFKVRVNETGQQTFLFWAER